MPAALIQLVAYGVEDLYLSGDPQITFFKIVYRRHTNFAIESVKQSFSSKADFGEKVTCTLGRTGDLIGNIMLYVKLPPINIFYDEFGCPDPNKKVAWARSIGYALIKETTFEIGGKLIDKQYGEWLYIWEELTTRQNVGSAKLVGDLPSLYDFSNGKSSYDLFIPLKYFFNRFNGMALPLIALYSTDVKITFTFRRDSECYIIGPTYSIEMDDDVVPFKYGDYISQVQGDRIIYGYFISFDYLTKRLFYIKITSHTALSSGFDSIHPIINPINNYSAFPLAGCVERYEITPDLNLHFVESWLYVDYVFLENSERQKFSRSSHEYLIDQIQYNQLIGVQSQNVGQNLNLSHPCKSHQWVVQLDCMTGPRSMNDLFNFTNSVVRYPDGRLYGKNIVTKATLLLNGNKRFNGRSGSYFNSEEPYSRYYRAPAEGINVYSFCFCPEEHQPSGSINMSKYDYITMQMILSKVINRHNTCSIRSYTLSHNILRIFYGLGGVAFT